MLDLALEKDSTLAHACYAGEGVVLISEFDVDTEEYDLMPFYFEDRSQAYEYIIRFAKALFDMGYRIADEATTEGEIET
jgi:hypothetical protein